MTHDIYLAVKMGGLPIWDGPIRETPWWWTLIMQIEERNQSLRESAAYDPEKLAPPKDLWVLSRAEELETSWFEPRRELAERKMREKQPLQNW